MTDRENQLRLDRLALQYLAALEAEDFDTLDELWENADNDADLAEMLHDLNAELVAEQDSEENTAVTGAIVEQIEKHLPSAEVLHNPTGPLTVSEVADFIRRHPPAGLTIDDLHLNDLLRQTTDPVPMGLGLSQVIDWGARYGAAPETYWRAFREVALDLWMQRTSAADNYQMAARPQRPKRPGDKK